MHIRIDDDFDNELEEEYKSIDNDSVIGNGVLANSNETIIEVNATNVDKNKRENANYNLDNGFSLKIEGATFVDDTYDVKENKIPKENLNEQDKNNSNEQVKDNFNKQSKENLTEEDKNKFDEYLNQYINEDINEDVKDINEDIQYDRCYCMNKKRNEEIKGTIRVISKLGDIHGSNISDTKINLYALNGLSPKFISSKITDKNGLAIFNNLPEGSYRVIEIVNRRYFEKPTYIQWNEVTINDELQEENIIVVNRIKRHLR